jgi:hypothetical protein
MPALLTEACISASSTHVPCGRCCCYYQAGDHIAEDSRICTTLPAYDCPHHTYNKLTMLFSAASSAQLCTRTSKQTAIRPTPFPPSRRSLILRETGLMLITVRGLSTTACLEHASMPVSTGQVPVQPHKEHECGSRK